MTDYAMSVLQPTEGEREAVDAMYSREVLEAEGEPIHNSWDYLLVLLRQVPTPALKKLVAERVAADAQVCYDAYHDRRHEGDTDMSKKPEAQRRAAVRDAKADRKFWVKKGVEEERSGKATPTSRASLHRAVDRANKTIRENEK